MLRKITKSILIIVLTILLLLDMSVFVKAEEWFKGGTLHKATVREWNNASYRNRLATAADWFTSITKADNPALQRTLDAVTDYDSWLAANKIFAILLETCVTELVRDKKVLEAWSEKEILDSHVVSMASLCYAGVIRNAQAGNDTSVKNNYDSPPLIENL